MQVQNHIAPFHIAKVMKAASALANIAPTKSSFEDANMLGEAALVVTVVIPPVDVGLLTLLLLPEVDDDSPGARFTGASAARAAKASTVLFEFLGLKWSLN